MKHISATLLSALFSFLVLTSCGTATSRQALDEPYNWNSTERAGLTHQGLLSQFLDSKSRQGERFYQYYFIQEPPQPKASDYDEKTILFCAGGPGRNPIYGNDNFLADLPGYRVVYFHLRGSGFSQIPEPNTYDQSLRSSYVVEDIELIRQKILGDKPWAAVVGYSYGTVLAQQYAHEYPDKLSKLILAAPMSRHQFSVRDTITAARKRKETQAERLEQMLGREAQLRYEMREKDLESLKRIIARNDFDVLQNLINDRSVNLGTYVPRVIGTILEDVDSVAGSLPLLIDYYAELQREYDRLDSKGKQEQYKNLFEYSPDFFRALRQIRQVGWVPDNDNETTNNQQIIGTIVVNEVLQHTKGISLTEVLKAKLQLGEYEKHLCDLKLDFKPERDIKKLQASHRAIETSGLILVPLTNEILPLKTAFLHICEEGPRKLASSDDGGSKRVFDVMNFYDGLNADVLVDIRPSDEPGGSNLISRISRRIPLLGRQLSRIGRSLNEEPKAWNPAEFKHEKPTLVIKGGADPVPAGGAAEYIYDSALMTKEKFLIEFPGIGHNLNLPKTQLRSILREQDSLWKGCEVDIEGKTNPEWDGVIKNTRTCLLNLFLNDSLEGESRDQLLQAIGLELQCRVKDSNKAGSMSGVRVRAGNLPYRNVPIPTSCVQKQN